MIHQCYTYLIGWTELDTYYYGVRFAIGCHPDDFWIDYFTSSDRVKSFRNECGEPDMRFTFNHVTAEIARNDETVFLKEFVLNNGSKHIWLNRCYGGIMIFNGPHTEETKHKLSILNRGRIPWNKDKSYEDMYGKAGAISMKKQQSVTAKGQIPWNKGRKMTEAERLKLKGRPSIKKGLTNEQMYGSEKAKEIQKKSSKAHKGLVPWNKGKKGMQVAWNKGKKDCFSEATLKQMSISAKNRKKVVTP